MTRFSLFFSLGASLLHAISPATAATADAKAVLLPPFVVEEPAQPLPWRYAELAGVEVLSCCPDPLTRRLIANHHRLQVLLAELLPPALQLKLSGPRTLIFIDAARQPPTSQEVIAYMALSAADQQKLEQTAVPIDDGRLRRRAPPPRYTFLPNLRLWDRDAQALFAIVKESEFDANRVALSPEYVAYILRNRLPALPPWFISGVLTLHGRATWTEDTLTLDRLDWLSETGSAALQAGPQANRALLPLGDFFAGDLKAGTAEEEEGLSLWQAQAALFIRWGLAGRGAPRRAALWRFAERASVEPVTEALFHECFGLDFATAGQQLTAHLPEAIRDRLPLRLAQRFRLPDHPLRAATVDEIARIKGDWERLEIGFVKAQFPALATKYLEQARRTLMRAYDLAHRDPRLLTAIGLCEVDAGNDATAREFLEDAAARSQELRPRACYELARLRFAAARTPATVGAAPLTPEQANNILAPLHAARSQEPPLPEAYTLMAEVFSAGAQPPTREQLGILEQGVRIFPHHRDLVYRTAELNLRHGSPDTARWLITLGLKLAPDAAARARFDALQAQLNRERTEASPR